MVFAGLRVVGSWGPAAERSLPRSWLHRGAAVGPCGASHEPSRANDGYSCGTFPAALLGIKG